MKMETKVNKLKTKGFIVLNVYKDELLKYGKDIEDVLGLKWWEGQSLATEVVEDLDAKYPVTIQKYTDVDGLRFTSMSESVRFEGVKVFADLFELLAYLDIPLRPTGFVIKNVTNADFEEHRYMLETANPDLSFDVNVDGDDLEFNLVADDTHVYPVWTCAIFNDTVVYESIKDYLYAYIGNPEDEVEEEPEETSLDSYEELRNDGFEIAGVTADDLKHDVFNELKLTWRSGAPVAEFKPSAFLFYLRFLPRSFTRVTWGDAPVKAELDSPELHKFKSFQEFLDYLGWEG